MAINEKEAEQLADMVIQRLGTGIPKPKGYYCWACGTYFNPPADSYCEVCKTYKCPNGHCFCSLSPETQKALDRAMASYGLWSPFSNPCRRK